MFHASDGVWELVKEFWGANFVRDDGRGRPSTWTQVTRLLARATSIAH